MADWRLPPQGEGAGAICTRKSANSFFSSRIRARVYTRSFMFFAVTSVTELRNKVSPLFDDVPLFPKNKGHFRENKGHFGGNKGHFGGNVAFFR